MTSTSNRRANAAQRVNAAQRANARSKRNGLERDDVLRAAAGLFSQRGYERVSIEDVATELGVKKASLYYYIESKQQLLLEICERWVDAVDACIGPIAKSALPPDEKLRRMIHAYIDLAHQDVFFRTAALWANDLGDSLLPALRRFRDCERLFENVIVAGQKAKLFKTLEPRLAVLALLGMCDAIPFWGRYVKYPAEQVAAQFCLVFESGILADGNATRGSWPRAGSVEEALSAATAQVQKMHEQSRELADELERAKQRLREGLARE